MVFTAYSDLMALSNLQPVVLQRFLRSFAVWAPVFSQNSFFHSALKWLSLVPFTGPVWPSGYIS